MSAPRVAGADRSASVHAVAADALASLIAQGESWPPESPRRFRNLMLDACGSDHRPLIDLLLRVGRHGLVDALRSLGTVRATDWPARRTTLVSMVVGELFVNAEIATWAVDAWAVALGVVPRDAAQALRAEYAARAASASGRAERVEPMRARNTAGARGAGVRGAGAPGAAASVAKQTPVAYVPGAPSWAGGAPASRVGAWVRGAPFTGVPRWRVPSAGAVSAGAGPIRPPDFAGFFVLLCVFGVFMLGFVMLMRSTSDASRDAVPSSVQMSLPAAQLPAPDASVDATTVISDSASGVMPTDVTIPSTDAADSNVFASNTDVSTARSSEAVAIAPLAGRYLVERRIVTVNGNEMCKPVAEALQRADTLSYEEFTQIAGTNQFALVSRPGVHGTVQSDGVFTTAPHRGTHDGVRYRFRMMGRTTPAGFVARTITETEAVIRYRRTQRCVVLAELTGTRRSW